MIFRGHIKSMENIDFIVEQSTTKKYSLSGSTLKIIAIIAMIIDHIAVVLLGRIVPIEIFGLSFRRISSLSEFEKIIIIFYYTMRIIGRISFPIFAYLLIEGFMHTKNLKKYAIRLGIFALISEIPYDLAMSNRIIYLRKQNVFFLLFISLLVIAGIKKIGEKKKGIISIFLKLVCLFFGMVISDLISTDYGYIGVLTIVVIYFLRDKGKDISIVSGCFVLMISVKLEIVSIFSLIPIKLYNGNRGLDIKYIFYMAYPAHLIILYFIWKIVVFL